MSHESEKRPESWLAGRSRAALEDALRRLDYDIAPARPGTPPDSELIARRDSGNRAILLTADQAGRFRVELTWLVGEWPSRHELAGTPVRMVDGVTRTVSIAGRVEDGQTLVHVVMALGDVVPWAATNGNGARPSPDHESSPELPLPP